MFGKKRTKKAVRLVLLLVAVFVAISVAGLAVSARAAVEINQLGRAPLLGQIEDRVDLAEKFSAGKKKIADIIRTGLQYSPEEACQVAEKLEGLIAADKGVTCGWLPDGSSILWMGWKSRVTNKLMVTRDIVLRTGKAEEGYFVSCPHNEVELVFFIPVSCGNLSLFKVVTRIAMAPAPAQPPKVVERVVEKIVQVSVPGPAVEVPGPTRVVEVEVPGPERVIYIDREVLVYVPQPRVYVESTYYSSAPTYTYTPQYYGGGYEYPSYAPPAYYGGGGYYSGGDNYSGRYQSYGRRDHQGHHGYDRRRDYGYHQQPRQHYSAPGFRGRGNDGFRGGGGHGGGHRGGGQNSPR